MLNEPIGLSSAPTGLHRGGTLPSRHKKKTGFGQRQKNGGAPVKSTRLRDQGPAKRLTIQRRSTFRYGSSRYRNREALANGRPSLLGVTAARGPRSRFFRFNGPRHRARQGSWRESAPQILAASGHPKRPSPLRILKHGQPESCSSQKCDRNVSLVRRSGPARSLGDQRNRRPTGLERTSEWCPLRW